MQAVSTKIAPIFFNQNLKNFQECIIFILVDELFSVYVCLYVRLRVWGDWGHRQCPLVLEFIYKN